MMRCFYQFVVGWVLFSSALHLSGQEAVFYFHRLTNKQHLTSQKFNYYIFKDSQGFVWISSVDGLNRYDGKAIKPYLPIDSDPFSLTESNIHSMFFEDKASQLWFSTSQAIQCYDRNNDNFKRYYIKSKSGANLTGEYQLLYLDTLKNQLWLKVENQLFIKSTKDKNYQYNVGNFEMSHKTKLEPGKNPSEHFLISYKKDSLCIVSFINGKKSALYTYSLKKNNAENRALSHYTENAQQIWVGTEQGLYHVNLNNKTVKSYNNKFKNTHVTGIVGIAPLGKDSLIVATREMGIYCFNKKSGNFIKKIYTDEEGTVIPFEPQIDRIYLDEDQTLWISTNGQGVYFTNLNKKKFTSLLQHQADVPNEQYHVLAMTEDNKGSIWCLTSAGISVVSFARSNGVPRVEASWADLPFKKEHPFYIFCDRSNRIWVTASSGVFVRTPETKTFVEVPIHKDVKLQKLGFTFIKQLSNDKILVSSQANGVFEIVENNGQFVIKRFKPLDHLSGEFTWIFEDSDGDVYFCNTTKGIYIFHQERDWLSRDTLLSLKQMVSAIIEDNNQKNLWVATAQSLYKLEHSSAGYSLRQDTVFNIPASVNGLLQDNQGDLWISTNNSGIIRYTPGQKNWRMYTQMEGLQSSEFNLWSFIKTRRRLFGFGGINGVNFFYPSDIKNIKIKAKPIITEILINDKPANNLSCDEEPVKNTSLIKKLVLPYRRNTLSFRFAALEYSDPNANQFRYQLSKVDKTFVYRENEDFARYPDLRPGNYTFEVQATNSDGEWSDQVVKLEIRIDPPWWRTWWATILFFLTGLGFVILIYQARIKQIQQNEAYHRKEAEYKQLIAETETAVLRLQMDPHFIFNSMNSINSYLLNKSVDTASDYLTRFANLMRMILKLAEKPFITITGEIEILERYLKVEAMRLEKKFTYHFAVDPELDPDEVELPTMILQPFVENAIWHGISPKEGEGHIAIRFWQKTPYLYCSIEDNGVGRAAAKSKTLQSEKHESKALSITERRLKLLDNGDGLVGSFEMLDLYSETGVAMGTKVVLELPIR